MKSLILMIVAVAMAFAGCSKPAIVAVQGVSETSAGKNAELEKCLTAASFDEYREKTGKWDGGRNSSGKFIYLPAKQISVPMKVNIEGTEIYTVPVKPTNPAGGHIEPIIKYKNQYCELTDLNTKTLFAPIAMEDAIKYLNFRSITLGPTTCSRGMRTVLDKSYYGKHPCSYNKDVTVTEEDKRITTLAETSDGFLIRWITSPGPCGEGYYQEDITLARDGKIIESKPELFIKCGALILF